MSRMLLLVALEGSIGADMDATMVAFAGTFTGLTIPMPTPPAVRELKNKTGASVVLVQLRAPSKKIKPIKLKDRDTMSVFIFNEINGKGRHLFQNPEIGISPGILLSPV